MELKELTGKTLKIFDICDVSQLKDALMDCVKNNDQMKMREWCEIVNYDLQKDWLQMIYQYYCADRKEKGQVFTPACLATFLSRLIGESKETIDMCAGSGALTIQRWANNPDTVFTIYEIDENVIPYLLFNMVIRNIHATIYQTDILQYETVSIWEVRKGEHFGNITCIKSTVQHEVECPTICRNTDAL